MKPAAFRMERPASLADALALLRDHAGDARPLAGGQSLVPMMNLRVARPAVLVDLNRIPGLAEVVLDGACLRIGAMARQQSLLEDPLLRTHAPLLTKSLAHVGHLQTRSRGTLGGSLAHADPAAELGTALVALDGTLIVRSCEGTRCVAARDFFIDAMTTALEDGELIVEVQCRAVPDARSGFHEFALRHGDFAMASAAVQCEPLVAGGLAISAAVGGVQTVPYYCARLAARIWPNGTTPADLHTVIDEEVAALDPLPDLHGNAGQKRDLARQALLRALAEALS
jgi:CO/xanthine dehydrogenase FAD-binding subunit